MHLKLFTVEIRNQTTESHIHIIIHTWMEFIGIAAPDTQAENSIRYDDRSKQSFVEIYHRNSLCTTEFLARIFTLTIQRLAVLVILSLFMRKFIFQFKQLAGGEHNNPKTVNSTNYSKCIDEQLTAIRWRFHSDSLFLSLRILKIY